MKTALIFGAGGQAGRYMVKFLNKKGYNVTALAKYDCNVACMNAVEEVLIKFAPDELYNFASIMHAQESWDNPLHYMEVNFLAVSNILHCYHQIRPDGRFFQPSSADIFGYDCIPQREDTPIQPRNPYGVSKSAAQALVKVYRESRKFYACTGILFNMESPLRKDTFFARKVAIGVSDIVKGKTDKLTLGDLTAVRDWGLVEEYVEAIWEMLQADEADDYVIGTGEAASCQAFVREACTVAGIDFDTSIEYKLQWRYPPDAMKADPSKIYKKLGWAAKTNWKGVVKKLVESELNKTKENYNVKS